jgi:transcriptional regulator with XRE-family HTH domain
MGKMIESHRLGEEMTQAEFAKRLNISQSHLCDIEKGRKLVSPERAMRFAQILGLHEKHWIKVAIDDYLRALNVPYCVRVDDAA